MEKETRHQCLVYEGSPAIHLSALAAAARKKLEENYRCLFLNPPSMVAGIRSYLAAAGIDVAYEVAKASLVISSSQNHLVDERFDIDQMLRTLDDAVQQALNDGYVGLWASGDMSWEFGPKNDFSSFLSTN